MLSATCIIVRCSFDLTPQCRFLVRFFLHYDFHHSEYTEHSIFGAHRYIAAAEMTPPKYWAILVGINDYPQKPLKGCVADVNMIQRYLESPASGSKPVTVLPFQTDRDTEDDGSEAEDTSSTPLVLGATDHDPGPAELGTHLHRPSTKSKPATHSNVLAGLETVLHTATSGDVLYIHYSGHGTTISFLRGKKYGDLALVLYDPVSEAKTKLLRGRFLADYLKRMVEKGLHVTLVLDCCFSGSVVRSGSYPATVSRFLPYNPDADKNDEDDFLESQDEEKISYATHRGLNILPRWVVEPDGYTILTACAPDEVAKEVVFNGTQHHGALSYFMMQALAVLRKRSHRSLYHQVRAQFLEHWPQQNPMRFGNVRDAFFATSISDQTSIFVPVFRRNSDLTLCLGAGLAHGVCLGDIYALYPADASEDKGSSSAEAYTTAKVTNSGTVTSDLLEEPSSRTVGQSRGGWKGKAVTSFQTQKIAVYIEEGLFDHSTWAETMSQTRFCRALPIKDLAVDQPTIFVTENECSELEIRDSSGAIHKGVPRIPRGTARKLDCVARLADHIATYRNVLRIANRNPPRSLLNIFEITVLDKDGRSLSPDFVELVCGDKITICICNTTDRPLHIGLCYLDAQWGVSNLFVKDGSGEFIKIPPQQRRATPHLSLHSGETVGPRTELLRRYCQGFCY